MKNGRALKGHKRILVAIERNRITHRAALGGWDVSCECGWHGGNWRNSEEARRAYREHLNDQISNYPIKCKRCGIEKPLSLMRKDYRYICLKCFSQMGNEWQEKHPARSAEQKRNHQYLKLYGITLEEAKHLLADQAGKCAICQETISYSQGRIPQVDHNHLNGNIRGVLCFNCNSGLGHFDDDCSRLEAAIRYLSREG